MVPGAVDQLEFGVWDQAAVRAAVIGRHDPVALTPQQQGRHVDPAEPTRQLRIVHVGVPGVEAQRLAIAGIGDESLVRHRVEIGREPLRIVPALSPHLLRRLVEGVEDVGGLTVADLDAERIDEHQLAEPMAASDRNLRCEPAAERKPDECHLLVRQRIQHFEVEMHEVIDRVEVLRPRRLPKPWSRWRYDLAVAAQQLEEPSVGINGLKAMQQQDRAAGAAAHGFELDLPDLQPLTTRHRSFLPSGARRMYKLVRYRSEHFSAVNSRSVGCGTCRPTASGCGRA